MLVCKYLHSLTGTFKNLRKLNWLLVKIVETTCLNSCSTTPGVRCLPAVAGLGAARGAEQAAGAAPAALLPRAARATRAPCTGTRGRTQPVLALGAYIIQIQSS